MGERAKDMVLLRLKTKCFEDRQDTISGQFVIGGLAAGVPLSKTVRPNNSSCRQSSARRIVGRGARVISNDKPGVKVQRLTKSKTQLDRFFLDSFTKNLLQLLAFHWLGADHSLI